MGIFDILFKKPEKTIDRRKIPAEEIDRSQRIEASGKYKNKVYKKYYADYPEKPFISLDRELYTDWLNYPASMVKIVPKEVMTRYEDGLLPGHIYMLYWLEKSNKKRIPSYFEYEYGIDFEKEKHFLVLNGYLDLSDQPTKAGKDAMVRHHEVIDVRHPTPKASGTPSVPAPKQNPSGRTIPTNQKAGKTKIPSQDMALLKAELSYINSIVKYACSLSRVTQSFSIDPSRLEYGLSLYGTHYEWTPYTDSGKASKYPLMLRFAYHMPANYLPPNECFGELYYLQNAMIGKARLIFWHNGVGHFFYLGQTKGNLVVKKVIKSNPPKQTVLYKECSIL